VKLKRVKLERFKSVREASIDLSSINILVGGNNSGKSSILEGFKAVAAAAARSAGTRTFTQDSLLFCPTKSFVDLRNGAPYRNQSNFGYLSVYADGEGSEDDELTSTVTIYRGRNEGNVGCDVSGPAALRQIIGSSRRTFSIYVPGLSGIPQVEEYRTESIVRRGIASGDANLYLRNVIYLIRQNDLLEDLQNLMRTVFPDVHIETSFNPKVDLHIEVKVSVDGRGGRKVPLELVGTGVQQALQILSYVVLFRPYILLLDEPDSHLHPDNQGLIGKAMLAIASDTDTTIITTTHSRHLVDALYDEGNIVWLKGGEVYEQGEDIARIPLLMDIGALDSFERLREGDIGCVFLTEDANTQLLKKLIWVAGIEDNEYLVYSYKTSSNLNSAILLAEFIREIAPDTVVVLHRDRDFMTDAEVEWVANHIRSGGAVPFITEECDLENYFVTPEHLGALLGRDPETIREWQNEIAARDHNEFYRKLLRKRDEAKTLYRNKVEEPPDSHDLIGNDNPLPREKRIGKLMLRKVRAELKGEFAQAVDVTTVSDELRSPRLREIIEETLHN